MSPNATRLVATMAATTIILVLAAGPRPALAQGWIDPGARAMPELVKLRTEVNVQVTDRVARVEVEEWFENRGAAVAEGDYLYPLAGEAVFAGYSLWQGEEELTGEMMDAGAARGIYEEIVRRRKDPALIELAGHGLLRARVFPIEPGQTRKITLRYEQVLDRAGDALAFRYAAGGRYGLAVSAEGGPRPGIDAGPRPRPGAGGPDRAGAPLQFRLMIDDGDRFGDPFSPTHELVIERDAGRLVVRPRRALHGDFALFLPFAHELVGLTLATHNPVGEDGYFMLTLSPGDAPTVERVPRDVAVVIDVSGSMSGGKLEDAKRSLRQLLGTLDDGDRFRVIAFNNRVRVHRPGWTEATGAALGAARAWVEGLRADGGTAIDDALAEAFRLDSPVSRLPVVVFLTDGLPSVGERDPERIAARAEDARGAARVFAFGIGYDVNTYLLDRLTEAARGATEYVEPGEAIEAALGRLAMKIRHPVLTDLRIADSPVHIEDLYPGELPDLFRGDELVILGRWRSADADRDGELRLEGRRGSRTEAFALHARFPDFDEANQYLPRLWAGRKIGELTREIRLHGETPELVEEIRRLALRHGILTEYTSYLVQEPGVLADGAARPTGWPPPFTRGGAGGRVTGAASSADAASGASAVRAAEAARRRRQAMSIPQLAAVTADAERELLTAATAAGRQARAIAGRLFVRDGPLWTDARLEESLPVVEIEAFGDAYFELLARLPEIRPVLAALEQVVIAGERVGIRVAPDGAATLPDAELDRIAAEFRGS